jgi:flagellar basal body-associated protein FliL
MKIDEPILAFLGMGEIIIILVVLGILVVTVGGIFALVYFLNKKNQPQSLPPDAHTNPPPVIEPKND